MGKTNKKQIRKTKKSKNTMKRRTTRRTVKRGGDCGCNKGSSSSLSFFGGNVAAPIMESNLASVNPSSIIPINNNTTIDPSRDVITSRQLPNSYGGKRRNMNKKSRKNRRKVGGIAMNTLDANMNTNGISTYIRDVVNGNIPESGMQPFQQPINDKFNLTNPPLV
jgi:hypothetical protein